MISITISVDQLRGAPPEVRRWIEGEVLTALSLRRPAGPDERKNPTLAICSAEEIAAMFSLIRTNVPAVNVFFELGHQGVSVGEGLEAYRLADLLPQARLRSADQLVRLLDMINAALQRVRGTAEVSLYGLDDHGHCFIAAQTRRAINELWARFVDNSGGVEADLAEPEGGSVQQSATARTPEGSQAAAD
jgi:hypothetical protein